jgi:NADPH:quinone reductase
VSDATIRIFVSAPGAPSVLVPETITLGAPGPGEVLVRQTTIGVNFVDIYHRSGLYLLPDGVPGVEAAGVVEEVGEDVLTFVAGDRVAYCGPPVGAYASARILPTRRLLGLPDNLSEEAAAAGLMRGMTAHMLLNRVYRVQEGTWLLVHAAAGGVGSLLTAWAKRLGAIVIGTVGSDAKTEIARAAGVDHVIVGRDADFVAAVMDLTHGRGVDFAIDGIGGATLAKTLAATRKFGAVASIGQSAGPIPPVSVEVLGPIRALSLTRPSVMAYSAEPETYSRAGEAVLSAMTDGLTATIGGRYKLEDAAAAHADLEGGRTTGSLLLIP